jgi:hypothetical protein
MLLTIDLLNPTDPSQHGWAKVEFWDGSLSGAATYQCDSGAVVTALAGVLPSQPMQFATVPSMTTASVTVVLHMQLRTQQIKIL